MLGDRILAIGDLSAVDDGRGRHDPRRRAGGSSPPGFIDPHGHSDGSLFLDGGLVSHLRQGFTTQLSGNCGDTLAPITDLGRELVDLSLRPHGLVARWRTFAEYLDAVGEERLGPNVAFLVGHGTVRGSVLGAEARPPTTRSGAAWSREVEAAMDAGAFGLSSGLIYAPGVHAAPDEIAALVTAATRRGGLYATHMRDEARGLFAVARRIDRGDPGGRASGRAGPRLQVSHLKCGSRAPCGAGPARRSASWKRPAPRASTWPPTSTRTPRPRRRSPRSCRPPCSASASRTCVAALADLDVRARVRAEIDRGISGWENIAADPGWDGIRDLVRRRATRVVRPVARRARRRARRATRRTSPSTR